MVKTIPVLFVTLLLTACQAFNSSNTDTEMNNAPISEAQSDTVPAMPTPILSKDANTTVNNIPMESNGAARTLTVQQGVSLMQVFRNNNLNISDLVAMTRVDSSGVLSSFQPGDKVQVILNNMQKVQSLTVPNGGRFLLQPNGTYSYSVN